MLKHVAEIQKRKNDSFIVRCVRALRAIREKQNDTSRNDISRNRIDVLFINGCSSAVPHPARYRVDHQIEQLSRFGITAEKVFYCDLTLEDELRAKTFVFFRCPITDSVNSVIDVAHTHGKRVFFDVDDLVIDTKYTDTLSFVTAFTKQEKELFNDGVLRNGQTLKLCDEAIVSTERLAIELGKYVSETFINRNVASKAMLDLSESAVSVKDGSPDRGSVSIGYFSGSMTHNNDFKCAVPAIVRIMQVYKDVTLEVIGDLAVPVGLERFKNRIHVNDQVDWRALPALIASVDINLVPLENSLFNEAKSENKWVDAALVRIPTIASDVGAFKKMIDPGKTGLLCKTDEDWFIALERLITDTRERKRIGQEAYSYCSRHCTTLSTGYPLAHKLTGYQMTIDNQLPPVERDRQKTVLDYLDECDLSCSASNIVDSTDVLDSMGFAERQFEFLQHHALGVRTALLLYERSSGDTATFRYFGYNVNQALKQSSQWYAGYFFVDEIEMLDEIIAASSIVILIRMRVRPDIISFTNRVHAMDVPVAYLIDDNAIGARMAPYLIDVMAYDKESSFEVDFWYGVADRFERAARLCDCFIAPTDFLADILRDRYGKAAFVFHSFLNEEQVTIAKKIEMLKLESKAEKPCGGFKIGYFSGTTSHDRDFSLIAPAISTFLKAHEDVSLVLCGHLTIPVCLHIAYESGQIRFLPLVDYQTLQLLQSTVDIVLAPLVVNEFSNCKSALKVFEAAIVGTATCASSSFANEEAIVDGETGYLCSSQNQWLDAFESIYQENSQIIGLNAKRYALRQRYGKVVVDEIETAFTEIELNVHPTSEEYEDIIVRQVDAKGVDWNDQSTVNPLFGSQVKKDPVSPNSVL